MRVPALDELRRVALELAADRSERALSGDVSVHFDDEVASGEKARNRCEKFGPATRLTHIGQFSLLADLRGRQREEIKDCAVLGIKREQRARALSA
jgi:hypothetical protein